MDDITKPRNDFIPAARFHFLTKLYDPIVAFTVKEQEFKRLLIKQADLKPQHCILDLACGTGTMTLWIWQSAKGVVVFGLDADPKILTIARRKAKLVGADTAFHHGFSTKLPYENEVFDSVFSSLFLHHLLPTDKIKTLEEVHRVLKPGGGFYVADWGKPQSPLTKISFFLVRLLDGFVNTRDNAEGTLSKLFLNAGFMDVVLTHQVTTVFGILDLYAMVKPGPNPAISSLPQSVSGVRKRR